MAKTYYDITTFTSGQILTAAQMNEVGTTLDNHTVPSTCQVYRSTDVTSYSSGADISWSAENWDTDGMWSSGTTITVNTTGLYLIQLHAFVSASATLTLVSGAIKVGGAALAESYGAIYSGTQTMVQTTAVASLSATNSITASIAIIGGSNYVVNGAASGAEQTRMSVHWIGKTAL